MGSVFIFKFLGEKHANPLEKELLVSGDGEPVLFAFARFGYSQPESPVLCDVIPEIKGCEHIDFK